MLDCTMPDGTGPDILSHGFGLRAVKNRNLAYWEIDMQNGKLRAPRKFNQEVADLDRAGHATEGVPCVATGETRDARIASLSSLRRTRVISDLPKWPSFSVSGSC